MIGLKTNHRKYTYKEPKSVNLLRLFSCSLFFYRIIHINQAGSPIGVLVPRSWVNETASPIQAARPKVAPSQSNSRIYCVAKSPTVLSFGAVSYRFVFRGREERDRIDQSDGQTACSAQRSAEEDHLFCHLAADSSTATRRPTDTSPRWKHRTSSTHPDEGSSTSTVTLIQTLCT